MQHVAGDGHIPVMAWVTSHILASGPATAFIASNCRAWLRALCDCYHLWGCPVSFLCVWLHRWIHGQLSSGWNLQESQQGSDELTAWWLLQTRAATCCWARSWPLVETSRPWPTDVLCNSPSESCWCPFLLLWLGHCNMSAACCYTCMAFSQDAEL